MNKYDKMIELNREKSDEKIAAAKLAIRKMLEEGDRITIPQLMKMTGLSRGFFYKNPIVRAEINQALEQQAGRGKSNKEVFSVWQIVFPLAVSARWWPPSRSRRG